MSLLGVVAHGNNQILSSLEVNNNSVIDISEKWHLQELDGIILTIWEKADISSVIEWLLICRDNPTLFIWIFSEVNLDSELNIFMSLGANAVIEDKKNLDYLNLMIKNTFIKTDQFVHEKNSEERNSIMNVHNQSVMVNGVEKELTKKEFKLFQLLYENQEVCMTYAELQEYIWPNEKGEELNKITNVVFHLREKIKESSLFTIKTVRSKGYLLTTKN